MKIEVDCGVQVVGSAESFKRFGQNLRYLPVQVAGYTVGWVVGAKDCNGRVILTLDMKEDDGSP